MDRRGHSAGSACRSAPHATQSVALRQLPVWNDPGLRAQVHPLRARRAGARSARDRRYANGNATVTERRWSARVRRRAAALLVAWWCCSVPGIAQDITEPSLKAAFVYNFAKFTQWPPDVLPASSPFVACVIGDAAVGDALERAVNGRLLDGRKIGVLQVKAGENLRACHLLYVSGAVPAQVTQAVTSVRGLPMLTVSDADDFARIGGIAHIFVENGKMRFALNLELAKRSRLQLSSKLLTLATRVYDGSNTMAR
ncbi:MAG: DUF4154 domain-containing protein [Luteitalea sp.]|nr:DUF4154 domain-containing protein [Luteitalea sp.]